MQSSTGSSTRRYDSSRRQARALETRSVILGAGRTLFVDRGYARTTMREIAASAGVALETVYSHFRTKPVLLRSLLNRAVGGDERDMPVADREWVGRIGAEPDARAMVARFAREVARVHVDLAPLLVATRAAAEADEAIAEVFHARVEERRAGMAAFGARLEATGELRPGLGAEQARDELYALSAPETYVLLVLETGWTPGRFADWLGEVLAQRFFDAPGR